MKTNRFGALLTTVAVSMVASVSMAYFPQVSPSTYELCSKISNEIRMAQDEIDSLSNQLLFGADAETREVMNQRISELRIQIETLRQREASYGCYGF